MIIRTNNFYESQNGDEPRKILSDDAVVNHAAMVGPHHGYLLLSQSNLSGRRLVEIELAPSEVDHLIKFLLAARQQRTKF